MEKEKFKKNVYQYLHLVALYLNKQEAPDFVIDKKNLPFFVKFSNSHSLSAFFYKAIKDTKVQIDEQYLPKLEEPYLLNVRKNVFFNRERKALYQYLNQNDIDFLPLKGLVIQGYYLDQDTREYADNDILFDVSNDELVKAFFEKRDYRVNTFRKSHHDTYTKKPFYNFEMHRELFFETEENQIFVDYFKDYLKDSPIKQDKEHYLKDEDFYIYFTAHSYKHYRIYGCGLRTLIDYYFYLNNVSLDFTFINNELKKLDLLDFAEKIKALTEKVFSNIPLTIDEEEMLMYIASSGTYGTLESGVDKGIQSKGKFRYLMSRVFPPLSFYKSAYPWAYKSKVLIPVAWFVRFCRIFFGNRKRMNRELVLIRKYKKKEKKK